jgi:cell division FtsZ-interacting protein ZapD
MIPDFDPYQHLMELTNLQHELAREVKNQSNTIDELIHHATLQQNRIKSMNARLLSAELQLKDFTST